MAKKDVALEKYFQDNARFADLLNTVLFKGKQVIRPEDVQEQDSAIKGLVKRGRQRFLVQKYRDVLRRIALGMSFVVVGIEHQDQTHFAMPVRVMLADAAAYDRQVQRIGRIHRKKRKFKEVERFRTDLRELFTFLQHIKDKDSMEKIVQNKNFSNLDEDAYEAMAALGDIPDFENMKDRFKVEGGKINMCKAFEELMESKWLEGREDGRTEGAFLQAEKTAYNMFRRGFSVEDVSVICELDQKKVSELFDKWKGKRRK